MPGWTGEPKWNYLKKSGWGMQAERRYRGWQRSMAFIGAWSGRRSARNSADTKDTGEGGTETRTDQGTDRADTATRSEGAPQTAAHGAPDLDAPESRTS